MSHAGQSATEAINADSFLDIVASVVSVMIIMVVMTGLKIKSSPVDVPVVAASVRADAELQSDLAEEQAVQDEMSKTSDEIGVVDRQASGRKAQLAALAENVTSLERKSQATRGKIREGERASADLGRTLAEANARLGALQNEATAAETAPGPSQKVECYPTPLSREVDGLEFHFRLRNNRLAQIPLDSLMWKMRSDAQLKVERLRDVSQFTEVIGPEGGFRLRYSIEKVQRSPDATRKTDRPGFVAQLKRWTLIPESDDIGEPIDRALAEGSQFRQALANPRARVAAFTIWTYPDSFDAFRQVKRELYRLGYAVAARPMPEGVLITGAPEGSKSAAQ